MNKIIGVGNALVDMLIKMSDEKLLSKFSIPKGSMQLVDKETSQKIQNKAREYDCQMASGGSAANTIHGLANLGVDTAYVGKIGEDHNGDFFVRDIVNNKIRPHILKSETETGCAIALISPDSERTFATYLGAAVELTPDDLTKEMFEGYDLVHIEGYLVANQGLIEAVVKKAKKYNCKISIDLASFNIVEDNLKFLKDIVKEYVDIVFANEEEAKAFTGKDPKDALEKIAGWCDIAVVKVGKEGSMIKKGDKKVKVDAIKAKAIDTTGAGDLYASGFLYGLSQGASLKKCGKIGALTSGKVVEVIGPKLTEVTWAEIRTEVEKIISE